MEHESIDQDEILQPPLDKIPDAWANQGNCPVCNMQKTLDVIHLEGTADQFLCQNCSSTFEVQKGSSNIRLKVLPEILKSEWEYLLDRWIDPVESQNLYTRYLDQIIESTEKENNLEADKPALTDDDVLSRVFHLKKLGNDNQKIKAVLEQAGASPDQVSAAITRVQIHFDQEVQGKSQAVIGMWIFAGLIVIIIVVLVWLSFS